MAEVNKCEGHVSGKLGDGRQTKELAISNGASAKPAHIPAPSPLTMEILNARAVDGFCIVSSDADYIGLAARIQQAGLVVYGFGTRRTMPDFVAACDEFLFLDDAPSPESSGGTDRLT